MIKLMWNERLFEESLIDYWPSSPLITSTKRKSG